MKQIEKPFKPDFEMTVRYESTTGRTELKSMNGTPINPLFMCKVLAGIVDGNLNAMLQQQLQAAKGAPHKFFVLPGETKCRHPYCTEPENSPIHITEEPPKETVQ